MLRFSAYSRKRKFLTIGISLAVLLVGSGVGVYAIETYSSQASQQAGEGDVSVKTRLPFGGQCAAVTRAMLGDPVTAYLFPTKKELKTAIAEITVFWMDKGHKLNSSEATLIDDAMWSMQGMLDNIDDVQAELQYQNDLVASLTELDKICN